MNKFCYELGVTRNDNVQHLGRLEQCIREELDDAADRRFAVLDPLPVKITNHPGTDLPVDAPLHPKFPERGSRSLSLTSTAGPLTLAPHPLFSGASLERSAP